jgi:hypothetical protein
MRQMDRQSCLMHEGMHKGISNDVVGLMSLHTFHLLPMAEARGGARPERQGSRGPPASESRWLVQILLWEVLCPLHPASRA